MRGSQFSFKHSLSILSIVITHTVAHPLGIPTLFTRQASFSAVCGADFRTDESATCLANGANFALTPPSTITRVAIQTAPTASECDHTVEIQLLSRVMNNAGICGVINALDKFEGFTKPGLLNGLFQVIRHPSNLNFVDATVNNAKKNVVASVIRGQQPPRSDINIAVVNFLQQPQIRPFSRQVAHAMDKNIAAILQKAITKKNSFPALPENPRTRLNSTQSLQCDLITAIVSGSRCIRPASQSERGGIDLFFRTLSTFKMGTEYRPLITYARSANIDPGDLRIRLHSDFSRKTNAEGIDKQGRRLSRSILGLPLSKDRRSRTGKGLLFAALAVSLAMSQNIVPR